MVDENAWRNKMDGEQKMYLGITVAIVAGIAATIAISAGLTTYSGVQYNTVKVACVESGKSLVYDQCVPADKIELVAAGRQS